MINGQIRGLSGIEGTAIPADSMMRRQMKSVASRGTFLREVNMAKDHNDENNDPQSGEIGRRDFVALSVAGIAVTAGWASAAALEVAESNVDIKTPDGTSDAAFIYPKSGSHVPRDQRSIPYNYCPACLRSAARAQNDFPSSFSNLHSPNEDRNRLPTAQG